MLESSLEVFSVVIFTGTKSGGGTSRSAQECFDARPGNQTGLSKKTLSKLTI